MAISEPKPVKFTNSMASVLLDLIRALAAFLVLISHWKIMFFVDYPQIPAHRIWFAAPYVLASAGHQAVIIFFVLSGYLISGSVFRALDGGFWRWRSYLTHRFTRLYVVLIPGLVLGGLFDWIGLHHTHVPDLYNGISAKSHHISVLSTLSGHVFFGNLAYLQTVLVPVFGSNSALWSLANELWYYILFPLCWLGLRRQTATTLRVLYLIVALSIAWFVGAPIVLLFPVWLAGTLLSRLPRLRIGAKSRLFAAAVYVPLMFFFAKASFLQSLVNDYLFGVATFFFLWVVLSATGPVGNSKGVHLIRQAARFSYTLYITHIPALLLLTALIVGDRRGRPDSLRYAAAALAVLVLLLILAFALATVTEFRTDRVRRWLELRLDSIFAPKLVKK